MNEHSKNFEKVKNYYDNGVGKWITAEEYKEITKEDYE